MRTAFGDCASSIKDVNIQTGAKAAAPHASTTTAVAARVAASRLEDRAKRAFAPRPRANMRCPARLAAKAVCVRGGQCARTDAAGGGASAWKKRTIVAGSRARRSAPAHAQCGQCFFRRTARMGRSPATACERPSHSAHSARMREQAISPLPRAPISAANVRSSCVVPERRARERARMADARALMLSDPKSACPLSPMRRAALR